MEWFDPRKSLPGVKEGKNSRRCLAYCKKDIDENVIWYGYVDVYFNPNIGWKRCEDFKTQVILNDNFSILKWTYWENIDETTD